MHPVFWGFNTWHMPTPPARLLLCKPFSFLYKFGFSKRADNRAEPPSNYLLHLDLRPTRFTSSLLPSSLHPGASSPCFLTASWKADAYWEFLRTLANPSRAHSRRHNIFHLFSTSVWARVGGDTTACL